MLGNEQGEVGVLRLLFRVFVAVSVDGDNSVGVLGNDCKTVTYYSALFIICILLSIICYLNKAAKSKR